MRENNSELRRRPALKRILLPFTMVLAFVLTVSLVNAALG